MFVVFGCCLFCYSILVLVGAVVVDCRLSRIGGLVCVCRLMFVVCVVSVARCLFDAVWCVVRCLVLLRTVVFAGVLLLRVVRCVCFVMCCCVLLVLVCSRYVCSLLSLMSWCELLLCLRCGRVSPIVVDRS